LFFKRKSFFDVGTILSVFVLLGAAAAVISGLIAEDSVWHIEPGHELLEDHETGALIFLGFLVMYTAFRLVFRKKISENLGWLSLVLALIGSSIVGYVGYLGGEMVFHYGTGVQQAEIQTNRADSLAALINRTSQPPDVFSHKAETENEEAEHDHKHH
jgi:uncharacterized membrane protein